jgi:aminocarboxymuconate-semialdehyde decarboxylase
MLTREQFFRRAFAAAASCVPTLSAAQTRPRRTTARSLKIDAWTHAIPQTHLDRLKQVTALVQMPALRVVMAVTELFDMDARFRTMDRFGSYAQVLTPIPGLHLAIAAGDPQLATVLVAAANDGLAALVAKYPERFRGWVALLPLHDPDAALVELDRAFNIGALGVQIETNIGGIPLDHPRFEPILARIAVADRPIWIHPFRLPAMPDFATEKISRYMISQSLGWPYETAVALSRLVFTGLFDRFPKLRIIGHHGGGMIPHFSGRLGRYLEIWGPRIDTELAGALPRLKKPLLDYFRMFYVDTALNGAPHAVECVLDFFGPDHVLFGTDHPFDPGAGEFIRDTIADIEALKLDSRVNEAIFGGNALRLLRFRQL